MRDTLERAGIPLCPQYGSSGFRIDFAAKHPTQPGRMVLAIECDGASYHSSDTARDRDRLRQEHLQGSDGSSTASGPRTGSPTRSARHRRRSTPIRPQ